jgi:pimeloyl-ACP methyl ester carboxylesterase
MYFEVSGKQVFATTGGKPFDNTKPTIVFLQGSGLDHTFWGLHSRFFAFRNYAVLVPDLPGHTHSEGPALASIEAIAMMVGWGFGSAGHLHQGPIPGNSMVASGRKVMRRNVPNALATDLKACDAYKNGEAAAAKIAVPVQVLIAEKDRMAPRKATMQLVEHLNNPVVHVIANSGHMIPQEAPNLCRQLLKTFIFANNSSR